MASFLEEAIPTLAGCLEKFESPETTRTHLLIICLSCVVKTLACIHLIARNVPGVFKKPFMVTRKNEQEEQHLVAYLCKKFQMSTHIDFLEKYLAIFDIVSSKNPEKILENNVIFLLLEKFDFLDQANQVMTSRTRSSKRGLDLRVAYHVQYFQHVQQHRVLRKIPRGSDS
jgi:hypothetical protein